MRITNNERVRNLHFGLGAGGARVWPIAEVAVVDGGGLGSFIEDGNVPLEPEGGGDTLDVATDFNGTACFLRIASIFET